LASHVAAPCGLKRKKVRKAVPLFVIGQITSKLLMIEVFSSDEYLVIIH